MQVLQSIIVNADFLVGLSAEAGLRPQTGCHEMGRHRQVVLSFWFSLPASKLVTEHLYLCNVINSIIRHSQCGQPHSLGITTKYF